MKFVSTTLAALALSTGLVSLSQAKEQITPDPRDWDALVAAAQGQTVYFNAWGGDEKINAYIRWAGDQVSEQYGVTVEHVKLSDTAHAVSTVTAEKAAGRDEGGAVDLIWINGENFVSMKEQGLLFGPWSEDMPNYAYVDVEGKPTVSIDFTVPVDGMEAPWGLAQLSFYYDSDLVENPPKSLEQLVDWAANNPGRFTYPQPPDFLGSTFLKQALYEVLDNPSILQEPVNPDQFDELTTPLWQALDALHPNMWRQGQVFAQNQSALRALFADGEIDLGFAMNLGEATSAIAAGEFTQTVRSFVWDRGTIGNSHFVAIPYNANAKEGAMVLANFLMSPQAQAQKQDPKIWGDFTILGMDLLPEGDQETFANLDLGVATLTPAELGNSLPEPHSSWMRRLEQEWEKRYAAR